MDYGSRASGDHLAPTPRFSYTLVRRHVLFRRGCGSTHLDTTAMQWRGSVTAAVRHDRGAVTQRRGIGMATHRASRCCSRRASRRASLRASPRCAHRASRRGPARAATHVTVQRPPVAAARGSAFVAAASSIRGPLRLYSGVAAARQRYGSSTAAARQRHCRGAAQQRFGSGAAAATRHGSPSRQPPRQPSRQPVAPAYVPAHAAPIATQPAQQPTLRPSLRPSRQPYLFRPIWNRTDHNTYTQRKCPGCVYDKCDAKRNDIIPHDRMTSN